MARIQDANFVFQKYMLKSEEDTNEMLAHLNDIKRCLTLNSKRYRSQSVPLSEQAIESTKKIIKTIENIASLNHLSSNDLLNSHIAGQIAEIPFNEID